MLLESVIVGTVASAVGLAAGVGMSFGLRALLGAVGLDIPSGDVVITSGTVITAFVVGVSVTLIASVGPALKASRIKPIAALRDTAIEDTNASLKRTLFGLAITGAGAAAFAGGIAGSGPEALQLLGLGVLMLIFGMFVLAPVIARPVMKVLGVPTKVSGATGHLAVENARRNPRRTAATSSALMIGVALVGFITILASSTKASTADAVDTSLRADYVVDSGSWGNGGFGTTIEDDLAAVPGVEVISPMRSTPVNIAEGSTEVLAVDTAVIDELMDLEVVEGSLPDVHGDSIALWTERAEELGLGSRRHPHRGLRRHR